VKINYNYKIQSQQRCQALAKFSLARMSTMTSVVGKGVAKANPQAVIGQEYFFLWYSQSLVSESLIWNVYLHFVAATSKMSAARILLPCLCTLCRFAPCHCCTPCRRCAPKYMCLKSMCSVSLLRSMSMCSKSLLVPCWCCAQ
jgi:hypothetical protein